MEAHCLVAALRACAFLFVLQPLAEYLIHRGCHAFRIQYHLDHHRTPFLRYDPSFAPYLASAAGLYLLPRFWLLWLALAKYQLSHTLSHYWWNVDHHRAHHKNWGCNYSFSADGAWVDRLFGTLALPKETRSR